MIKQKEVDVQNAKLNLSYTVITAKQDGFMFLKFQCKMGQFYKAGAQLFKHYFLNNDKWIVANFKKTQLNKMVERSKVEVNIDVLFPR